MYLADTFHFTCRASPRSKFHANVLTNSSSCRLLGIQHIRIHSHSQFLDAWCSNPRDKRTERTDSPRLGRHFHALQSHMCAPHAGDRSHRIWDGSCDLSSTRQTGYADSALQTASASAAAAESMLLGRELETKQTSYDPRRAMSWCLIKN